MKSSYIDKHGSIILIYLSWFVYTSSYLGRYSYNANINAIILDYHVSHASAGLVATFFFFSYGIGQVINGILCCHYPKRYIIPLALIVSAGMNLLLFRGVLFENIKFLWLINGIALSFLWTSLIQTLGEHIEKEHLQKSVVVMSTTVAFGNFLAYGTAGAFSKMGFYQLSFPVSAAVMLTAAVLWFIFFPLIEKRAVISQGCGKIPIAVSSDNYKIGSDLLSMIVILCVFAIADNLIKDGIHTWMPVVLSNEFGFLNSDSIFLTMALNLCAVLGTYAAVKVQKRIGDLVILSTTLYAVIALLLAVFLLMHGKSFAAVFLSFGLVIVLTHAINDVLTSMVPLYLRDRMSTGLLSGVLNGCCYVGSTFSSYGLGEIADLHGWNSAFVLLLAIAAGMVLVGIIYGKVRKIKRIA